MTTVRAGDQEQSGSLKDRNLRGEVMTLSKENRSSKSVIEEDNGDDMGETNDC